MLYYVLSVRCGNFILFCFVNNVGNLDHVMCTISGLDRYIDQLTYRLTVNGLSVDCQPTIGGLSTDYWLSIVQQSLTDSRLIYQPTVDR